MSVGVWVCGCGWVGVGVWVWVSGCVGVGEWVCVCKYVGVGVGVGVCMLVCTCVWGGEESCREPPLVFPGYWGMALLIAQPGTDGLVSHTVPCASVKDS